MEITVQTIYQAMARLAPPQLAESWDNVGLLVDCGKAGGAGPDRPGHHPRGRRGGRQLGCGVIVSHHPVIFSPLKKLGPKDVPFLLVEAGISAVCMHTNYDAAEGGVNEILAAIFGMRNPEPFAKAAAGWGRLTPSRWRGWPPWPRTVWAPSASRRWKDPRSR